jgi:hypothetical protein
VRGSFGILAYSIHLKRMNTDMEVGYFSGNRCNSVEI